MNFLYPQFLWALTALAIPVMIHLFNLRKVKKVHFTNNAFLHQVQSQNKSKQRIKHLLILCSRMLALAFLVIAFARPFIPASEDAVASDKVNIYLDNSLSMSNKMSNDNSAFDEAISYVNTLSEVYPEGTKFRLLTNDFSPISNRYLSKKQLGEYLTELKMTGVSRPWTSITSRLKQGNEAGQTFWLSDFQKSTMGDLDLNVLDSSIVTTIVPLDYDSPSNILIDTVYLGSPSLSDFEQNHLHVKFVNRGSISRNDVPVRLLINDFQTANTTVDLSPGEEKEVVFDLGNKMGRVNKGLLEIQDFPVSYDNDYYFTLKKAPKLNIADLAGNQMTKDIGHVFSNDQLFDYKRHNASNLDYSLFNRSDFVVLNGLDDVDEALSAGLQDYMSKGGVALLLPTSNAGKSGYKLLGRSLELKDKEASRHEVSKLDLEDPFFDQIFDGDQNKYQMFEASMAFKSPKARDVKMRYENGQPFLFEEAGQKNLWVLNSQVDDEGAFNNHALFVPMMYKLANSSRGGVISRLAYYLNEPMVGMHLDSISKQDVVALKNDGFELIPAQQFQGNKLMMELPKDKLTKGFYDITLDGRPLDVIALNPDKSESYLENYSLENMLEMASSRASVNVMEALDSKDFAKTLTEAYQGRELWVYAVIFVLFFLLGEVLIIRFVK
ncbi:BatA domain-containing protein [Aureibacter tunicatorum]|uniref:Aerotolerance regulator N-terminal domain-containing protein n=1 Tax=Aureibacter tunicatorum TaxID=866807 RepID=A0AAE3XTE8_9BACT|nr:BatA domain-containing protein [Aureibacter tunicatorum]MDR6241324.1 hypothetical protein [Aureibacter tunicatorum]BDD03583.1 hypothetical protein AUTU_10660 [Aureibacter tunicatorum]